MGLHLMQMLKSVKFSEVKADGKKSHLLQCSFILYPYCYKTTMQEGRLAEKRVLMGISQVSIASTVTVLTCHSPVYFSNIITCFPEEEVKLVSWFTSQNCTAYSVVLSKQECLSENKGQEVKSKKNKRRITGKKKLSHSSKLLQSLKC